MNPAHSPKLPPLAYRAPATAGTPNFVSQNGKVTLYGVPFVRQPDGTWLCPLPNPGVTTIDGTEYLMPLLLIPASGNVTPPPPVLRPTIQGLYLPDRQTRATTGRPGDPLVVLGANLGTGDAIRFGGAPAPVVSWGPDAVVFTVPNVAAGRYSVGLWQGLDRTSVAAVFTVLP